MGIGVGTEARIGPWRLTVGGTALGSKLGVWRWEDEQVGRGEWGEDSRYCLIFIHLLIHSVNID